MNCLLLYASADALVKSENGKAVAGWSGAGPWVRWKRRAGLRRLARHDPESLRRSIDLGGLLHRRFDCDIRSLNLWKNSRSRFFKQPLVVLID